MGIAADRVLDLSQLPDRGQLTLRTLALVGLLLAVGAGVTTYLLAFVPTRRDPSRSGGQALQIPLAYRPSVCADHTLPLRKNGSVFISENCLPISSHP